MRLKELFTVPAEQKVTERHMRRVLISSICSILLCMSCLVSTTWAWFAVSVENTGNVIQIGTPEVNLTVNGNNFKSGDELPDAENKLVIEHANELDDFQKKSTLYVTLTIQRGNDPVILYTTLNNENGYSTEITINAEKEYAMTWTVSWFAAVNAIELIDGEITLTVEDDSTEPPTERSTEPPATEQPTGAPTEPPTEPPTEQPTELPTEQPTELPTEQPTETPTEQPTETPTEQPTETPTEQPTDAPTESTTEAPTNPETT